MARRNLAEVATGAVVLIVAAVFLGYAISHSGRSAVSGYTLTAKFDRMKLTVQPEVKIPKDSSAEITSDGLLGGKYLSLVPGGSETMLANGQTIDITQSAVSLEQLLGKFIFSVTDMVNAVKPQDSAGKPPAK